MRSSPFARRLTFAAAALPCVAAVMIWGELSVEALVVIGTAGTAVVVVALVRQSGETAPPVGRRGLPWLALVTAAVSWELVTLADDELPTASDLADPLLAEPLLRGAATVCWLAVGAWLLDHPRRRPQR
ncbi:MULTISPECIES: hypothetical protein [unclassified Modestobacter]|uniref:hypothetical protein n=1 Tax=unclassified Modestobacter TaxID=2643866 RepID=UPI0022AAFCB8|nr:MULTISPECIES: hypothetical protein [unclassified Modestobacter]MCZ2826144.1 hypothetical protein [Modestobacter sp. VKM Ac-2981]MCZ2852791.1 hypothetical protein [Modestobacter sp. VKM Ac-2982]